MSVSHKLTNAGHHVSDVVQNVGDAAKERAKESASPRDESDEHHANHELSTELAKANILSAYDEVKDAGARGLHVLKEKLGENKSEHKSEEVVVPNEQQRTHRETKAAEVEVKEGKLRMADDTTETLWDKTKERVDDLKERVDDLKDKVVDKTHQLKQDLLSPTMTEHDRRIVERDSEERAALRDQDLLEHPESLQQPTRVANDKFQTGFSSENKVLAADVCSQHNTEQSIHSINEKADDVKEMVKDKLNDVKHKIEEGWDATKDRAEGLWNTTKQRAHDIMETLREKQVENREGEMSDMARVDHETLEQLRKQEEEEERSALRNEMNDSLVTDSRDVTRGTNVTSTSYRLDAKKEAERLGEEVEHAWEKTKGKAEEIWDSTKDKVQEVKNNAHDALHHKDRVPEDVRKDLEERSLRQQESTRRDLEQKHSLRTAPRTVDVEVDSHRRTIGGEVVSSSCENVAISAEDPEVDTVHSFKHEIVRSA